MFVDTHKSMGFFQAILTERHTHNKNKPLKNFFLRGFM